MTPEDPSAPTTDPPPEPPRRLDPGEPTGPGAPATPPTPQRPAPDAESGSPEEAAGPATGTSAEPTARSARRAPTAPPASATAPVPAAGPPAVPFAGLRAVRRDVVAAGAAVALFVVAAVVGTHIEDSDGSLHVNWPPLYARWDPHLGPGTAAAVVVAVLVTAYGPVVAARLPWRALLPTAWAASMAWTWSLALVDGWHRGIAQRLTTSYEYLQSIDRFDDIGATLRDFTHHILIDSPAHWPPHVAGHPPAATLTFVGLDRIGLGGGAWAAVWVLTVGTSAAAAVLVALRALTDEATARRAAPFLVLAPAAVWAGVSADGYYTAVAAWAVALLALAATRTVRAPRAVAFASGLLFGLAGYLSYGLTLFVVFAAGVLLLGRTLRPLPLLLAGTAVVPLVFTLAGFNWWEAYHLLVERYYQGAGGVRPYGYWVWADLACTVLVVGLATVGGLRRVIAAAPGAVWRELNAGPCGGALRRMTRRTPTRRSAAPAGPAPAPAPADRLVVLVSVALIALLAADLSGMSKGETERIWLPFAAWLLPASALLPPRSWRWWLCVQALVALLVNHLLFTGW